MASFNFCKVIIGGRLTCEPELKTTPSGIAVTSFSVAVNRRSSGNQESQAYFFNVTAWRQTAEFVTKYFHKASSICIVGTLQNRTWTDQQGQKRFATDIVADEVHFVDAKSEMPQQYAPPAWNTPQNAQNDAQQHYTHQVAGYSTTGQTPIQSYSVYSDTHSKLEELNQEPAFSTDEELPF